MRSLPSPARALVYAAIASTFVPASALAGGLDPTFGSGGGVVQDLPGSQTAYAVAPLPDGRLQVAGIEEEAGAWKLMLRRYLASGAPDPSFGAGGVSRALIGGHVESVGDIALQPDGRIVVALTARTTKTSTDIDAYVARFSATGIYDSTFGTRGVTRLAAPSTLAAVSELALATNGSILLSHSESGASKVARIAASGQLDTSFGTGGIAAYSHPGSSPTTYPARTAGGIKLMRDGSILQAVSAHQPVAMGFVVKYAADGSSARVFGDAILQTATDVDLVGSDVIVAGNAACPTYARELETPYSSSAAIARMKTDGTMRTTWGSSGTTTSSCATHGYGEARSIAVRSGVVALAGTESPYSHRTIPMVWRLTGNGTLHAAFGTDGAQSVEFGGRTGSYSNHHAVTDLAADSVGFVTTITANARSMMDVNPGDDDTGLARVTP